MRKQNKESGKCPGKVRVLQLMCWGMLFLVQLFLIRCLETQAAEGKKYPERDHAVKVWEFRMVSIPLKEIPVERDVIYEQVEALSKVPEFMEFSVEEEGRTANVSCWSDDMEAGNARWSSDFSFPVTFHGCDAEYCRLEDVLIPYREEKPELDGYEMLLLRLIGAPEDAYRVTDIFWDGEIYMDETGTVCRNALAVGEKLVQDVQVHYVGTAEFPACEEWKIAEEYEFPCPEWKSSMKDQPGQVLDESTETVDGQQEFWQNIIRTMTIAFSLLLILLFVIVVVKRRL
ncbi:MAG: hypothetical protein ACI39W_05175 [Brotaphodocola sp.]